MLHERIEAVRPIAEKINQAEQSFNQSLQLIGELLTEIPRVRTQLAGRVPLTVGIAASEKLAAAALATTAGYKELVEAHGYLAEDRDLIGLRTIGLGDIGACPPSAKTENGPGHLNIVKAA